MTVYLTCLITKTSSDQFGVYPLAKISLYFWYSYTTTNFKFRIFIITFLTKLIYVLFLTSPSFILIVLWYVLPYLFTISSNVSKYTFFDIEVMYLQILVFKVLIYLSTATDFLHNVLNKFLCYYLVTKISKICYKVYYLYPPIFYMVYL